MGRVVVLGAAGMLGRAVVDAATHAGHEVAAWTRAQCDIANPMDVVKLAIERFDTCVNCAAFTAVDLAETQRDAAWDANALGPGLVAQACAVGGTRLIHVSTDFVFAGDAGRPYREDDPAGPVSWYGETKLAGEEGALHAGACVVRTSWLFGRATSSFPLAILRAYHAGKPLRVVADQTGTPTYAPSLARLLVRLLELDARPHVLHVAGLTLCTRYDWARMTLDAWRRRHPEAPEASIEPISSEDWPAPAQRPKMSALDCGRMLSLGLPALPPLHEELDRLFSGDA